MDMQMGLWDDEPSVVPDGPMGHVAGPEGQAVPLTSSSGVPLVSRSEPLEVYTDGACAGNPGPGGWAWTTADGRDGAGSERDSTNQRMEIMAALQAVRSLDGPVHVVSDSTYVVNCFKNGWWKKWQRTGWLTSNRTPVANRDLWEPLVHLVAARGDIEFRWVKGHNGHPLNERADALAVAARRTQAAILPGRRRSGGSPAASVPR